MAVKLNRTAFAYAKELIREGKVVVDDRNAWSEHQPSEEDENELISQHGFGEFAKWHLAQDDDEDVESKRRYALPFGDFAKIHRCAVLIAESRAGQYRYLDIQEAAAHLHGMFEALRAETVRSPAR
jgi:hypothetical protein